MSAVASAGTTQRWKAFLLREDGDVSRKVTRPKRSLMNQALSAKIIEIADVRRRLGTDASIFLRPKIYRRKALGAQA